MGDIDRPPRTRGGAVTGTLNDPNATRSMLRRSLRAARANLRKKHDQIVSLREERDRLDARLVVAEEALKTAKALLLHTPEHLLLADWAPPVLPVIEVLDKALVKEEP